MRVPDLIEPFVAWRVWDVCVDGDDFRLESLFYPTVWNPGPVRATCRWNCPEVPADVHIDPETYGSTIPCGIYAAKSLMQAANYLPAHLKVKGQWVVQKRTRVVLGKVAMWGVVKEHEKGYRSEYAKPVELWVPTSFGFPVDSERTTPEHVAAALRSSYDVPVKLFRHIRDVPC